MRRSKAGGGSFVFLAAAVILADQLSKFLALKFLSSGKIVPLPGPFELRLIFNPGGAYGILAGAGTILIVFSLMALAVLFLLFYRTRNFLLGLLFGGVASTLIDRVRLGYVIDFFHITLSPFDLLFQVFNLADCAIFFGLLILIYRTLTEKCIPSS